MTPYDETDYAMLELAEEASADDGPQQSPQSAPRKSDEIHELKNAMRRANQQRQRRRRLFASSRR